MGKKRDFKRVVFGSDMHCGHRVGLTPPDFMTFGGTSTKNSRKYFKIREALWEEYSRMIDKLKPIDIVVHNGDAVDGKGHRSGGTEIIMPEMKDQIDAATTCLQYTKARKFILTRGTAYHVSPGGEDCEDFIAEALKKDADRVKIGDHEFINVNGCIFDIKHHLGNTSVSYGKGTPIGKDQLHNDLWAIRKLQPNADVIVRSHVHNFFQCGDVRWLGLTTPALQGMGSKFGARRCSGLVDFGLVWFDVYKDGRYTWGRDCVLVEEQKATVTKL